MLVVVFFFFLCDAPVNKCPRHLNKVQCSNALFNKVRCPGHLKVLCPWHYRWLLRSIWVHCLGHPSLLRVLTSGTGTARFLTSAGLVSLSKDQFLWVSSSHGHNQRPLVLAGQSLPSLLHLCTCDGGAHCCIAC